MEWDLTPLYASFDDPALERDLKEAEQTIPKLAKQLETLDKNAAAAFAAWLEALTEQIVRVRKASMFVSLTLSTDATNARALALQSRVDRLTRLEMRKLYSAAERFVDSVPDLDALTESHVFLKAHAFMLREWKADAAHQLDPALEPWMLRLQLTGGNAWSNLRGMLEGTMTVSIEMDGEQKRLPLPVVRNMAHSPDPDLRKRAYEAELASYAQVETAMAAALNALKGEALTFSEARHYDSLLDQTLEDSRMDRATLDALLTAMQEALPDFRRYLKAKAVLLGRENGLPFYDLFAPVGAHTKSYAPEQARAYLAEVLGKFSPALSDFVKEAFDERWIDLFPKEGKRGGAFCAGFPSMKRSWVFMNYDGSFSGVSTLAHELGHAFHNRCLEDAPVLMSSYPMPLAETASIFNETLVTQFALSQAAPEEAFALLDSALIESTQVIVDIYSRYLFETKVVEACKTGTLRVDQLKDAMLCAQRESYGDGLDPDCLHPYMWACKSHYYSTGRHFYNFPYAFGLLFGLGVYAKYEAQGQAFVPVYERLLKATAGDTVAGVAASVGIDVRDPAFWRASLDVIRGQIDRFEALAGAQ